MKIHPFTKRSITSPTNGVNYTTADQLDIAAAAKLLVELDPPLLMAIRDSLARQIIHLDEVAEWTPTGTEIDLERQASQQSAIIAYEATYAAHIGRQFLPVVK